MTSTPNAPAGWFDVLLDREAESGLGLPDRFRAVYGGDWHIPEGPYLCVNFVTARDGRVSFSEPGHAGGGDVSGFDERDRWLMGLARSRVDAVMVGDGTMSAEPEHLWTPAGICPDDADAFAALRALEGRRDHPLLVVVSKDGRLPWHAEVFGHAELEIVVVTAGPAPGEVPPSAAAVSFVPFPGGRVDFGALLETLAERFGVRSIVCEGGPRLYGTLLRDGIALDELVTLSPIVIGDDGDGAHRPSLVEGVRFAPGTGPRSRLVSVRSGGDHLYLRSRYGGSGGGGTR
jgi:riboflavin biosynthesis pyrimidine reductase